jgi:hypothetical protein
MYIYIYIGLNVRYKLEPTPCNNFSEIKEVNHRLFCGGVLCDLMGLIDVAGVSGPHGLRGCSRCNVEAVYDLNLTQKKTDRVSWNLGSMLESQVISYLSMRPLRYQLSFQSYKRDAIFCDNYLSRWVDLEVRKAVGIANAVRVRAKESVLLREETGISKPTSILFLPHLDGSLDSAIFQDLMHFIKNIFSAIMEPLFKESSLDALAHRMEFRLPHRIALQQRLVFSVFNHERGRPDNIVSHFARLKASMQKDYLIIYGPILFFGILPNAEIQYTLFALSWVLEELCMDTIAQHTLDALQATCVRIFVCISEWYAASNLHCQITIHMLLHLAESTRKFGPLRFVWLFGFERFNN